MATEEEYVVDEMGEGDEGYEEEGGAEDMGDGQNELEVSFHLDLFVTVSQFNSMRPEAAYQLSSHFCVDRGVCWAPDGQ